MKKKLFSIIMSLVMATSILTGCNLFTRDTDAYLTQVVAKVGDVEITKEEFINGYYNYGASLMQNGTTQEDAVKQTIDMLLQRGLLLQHVKAKAQEEVKANTAQEDYVYEVTTKEYNNAVRESWDYIDGKVKEIVSKYVDLDGFIPGEEEEAAPTYNPETKFEAKIAIENVNGEWKVKKANYTFENEDAKLNLYNYERTDYASKSIMDKAWSEYLQTLREDEKQRNYHSKNNTELINRELDRIFKVNLDNAYLSKFQRVYEDNYGYGADGYLTQDVIAQIIKKYTQMYNANVEEYNVTSDGFYNNVIATDKGSKYVYFGQSEAVLEVQHILVKFDEDAITAIKEDPYLTQAEKDSRIAHLKSVDGTIATKRDNKGFDTDTKLSVSEIYNNILNLVAQADAAYTRGSDLYADFMSTEFNKLVYQYNQDEGILNAQFDYRISTGHSTMVDSFTDATRALYDNGDGYIGAVSAPIESEYGYHIIILSNVCTNLDPASANVETLYNKKTSRSAVAEDNYLEFLYSQVVAAEYSSFETRVLNTLKSGLTFKYFESRYKDYL